MANFSCHRQCRGPSRCPENPDLAGMCLRLCRLDRDHSEGVQFAALIGDRNIFARCKFMRAEAIARLVVIVPIGIVVEHPAGMLSPARLMDQVSYLVRLALPKSANVTLDALGLPSFGIDMSLSVQWGDELLAGIGRSRRILFRSSELKADRFEWARNFHEHLLLLPNSGAMTRRFL